jgi:glucosamine--fructose-6-phosphate aminotransferase (isomerizing)
MKELSYINAEGYPAGEIKHGPIALIDQTIYTIALAPPDKYFDKTVSNIQEILARGGPVLLLTSAAGQEQSNGLSNNKNIRSIFLPDVNDVYAPFLQTVALHLLAYYTAQTLNRDIDKPRNLAKSVTVE